MSGSMTFVNGPGGGTPIDATSLNKLAVTADISTPGTPTGDALKAAIDAAVAAKNLATQTDAAGYALIMNMIGL